MTVIRIQMSNQTTHALKILQGSLLRSKSIYSIRKYSMDSIYTEGGAPRKSFVFDYQDQLQIWRTFLAACC